MNTNPYAGLDIYELKALRDWHQQQLQQAENAEQRGVDRNNPGDAASAREWCGRCDKALSLVEQELAVRSLEDLSEWHESVLEKVAEQAKESWMSNAQLLLNDPGDKDARRAILQASLQVANVLQEFAHRNAAAGELRAARLALSVFNDN